MWAQRYNFIFLLFVMFVLGFNLVLPFFSREDSYASADPALEPYIIHTANNTGSYFGTPSYTTVNLTYFKQLFNAHTNIYLEYRNSGGTGWNDGNSYMDIVKTWNDTLGGWKISFIFHKPFTSNDIDARFTFNCDLPVLDFIVKDSEENRIYINYTVPGTNFTYYVYFDYTDLLQYSGLLLNKLVIDNQFYFTIQRNNIPNTYVGDIVLDPFFGVNDVYGIENSFGNSMRSYTCSPSSDGEVYYGQAYLGYTFDSAHGARMVIYYDSNNTLLKASTNEITITTDGAWYNFSFGSGVYVKSAYDYKVCVWGNDSGVGAPTIWGDLSTGDGDTALDQETYQAPPTDPQNPADFDYNNLDNSNLSLYIVYNESGGGPSWNLNLTCSGITGGNVSYPHLNLTCSGITGGNITFPVLEQTCSSITGGNITSAILEQTCSGITGGNITFPVLEQTCSSITGGNISAGYIWNLNLTCSSITGGNGTPILNLTCQDITGGNISAVNYSNEDLYNMINWINQTLFNGSDEMEIGLNENMISIILTFGLFIFFFFIGYTSQKRSGGAFMLFSGFVFLSFEFLTASYLNALYLVPLLTPVAIFIMLLGGRKWLYPTEGEKNTNEGINR